MRNVHVRAGDGYAGWPEEAPFDAVIVTAAPDHVPQPLVDQLKTRRPARRPRRTRRSGPADPDAHGRRPARRRPPSGAFRAADPKP